MSREKRTAVYAASLDPITNGHLNIIERASKMFDHLFILVAVNGSKKYMFTSEERLEMAKDATKHLPNTTVLISEGVYIVKHAEELGASFNIRGIRNGKDFEDEQSLNSANKKIRPEIETIWIPCDSQSREISSSFVKGHIGIDPEWKDQVRSYINPFVLNRIVTKYVLGKAGIHFTRLLPVLNNDKSAWLLFDKLVARYSEKHRHYHTLEHIVNMLDEFEYELSSGNIKTLNSDAIRFAIWFHDYIYDTQQKVEKNNKIADNEERSAYYFSFETKEFNLKQELIDLVSKLIMATKHNCVLTDYDSQILADLDLTILGKTESIFYEYENNIRKEYEFVDLYVYGSERLKILQKFFKRKSIYSTKFFKKKYEESARTNLRLSINSLLDEE